MQVHTIVLVDKLVLIGHNVFILETVSQVSLSYSDFLKGLIVYKIILEGVGRKPTVISEKVSVVKLSNICLALNQTRMLLKLWGSKILM